MLQSADERFADSLKESSLKSLRSLARSKQKIATAIPRRNLWGRKKWMNSYRQISDCFSSNDNQHVNDRLNSEFPEERTARTARNARLSKSASRATLNESFDEKLAAVAPAGSNVEMP